MPVTPLTQVQIITFAKPVLAKEVAKNARAQTFGLKFCKGNFNRNLMCWLIIDMFECNSATSLTQGEKDCLLRTLESKLTKDCCS